ncbi:CLUMA_CG018699, isoform A [Clunio marinus]|uniref:CLUMA_CG018699, isoform A n=1 Tax=Clunio marinus TaxID=568069 RepID=A0A1J1J155_9DIPT|nr:CLUMA_CG018699, isoform A [Clunio marinus]
MDEYPTWVGFIFVFNLIVGTGSLLLPSAFAKTGWLLSTGLIIFLAFSSYLTVTFVIEALSCSNAILKWRRLQFLKREKPVQRTRVEEAFEESSDESSDDERNTLIAQIDPHNSAIENTPLTIQNNDFYTLDEKVELGEMSTIFFPSVGSLLFYVCIAVYLYGDLSIYSAAVSTTLRDVICDRNTTINNTIVNASVIMEEPCWAGHFATRFDVYRICLIFFSTFISPWVFFNVSKTKYLQFLTLSFRLLSFLIMISIACYRIASPPDDSVIPDPPTANFSAIPFLIGTCIYSFMSQHSLPSLLVPIKEKHRISEIVSKDYFVIAILYIVLALTGIFAFDDLKDLYTLNFIPTSDQQSIILKTVEYFLALFPVLTLTTSFPIIAITLRNNLQTLFINKHQIHSQGYFVRNMAFPLMAIIPPFIITFNTENVQTLVSFTGCYAGACIQYLIPAALVYYSRKTCANIIGEGIVNDYKSKFQSNLWLLMIFSWTGISLIFVTIHLIS